MTGRLGPADLVAFLEDQGDLGPGRERVAEAMLRVPRHLFAPDAWWEQQPDSTYMPRFRADDERAWQRALYASNSPMVTQVDEGRTVPAPGAVGRKSSCSLSAPGIVATMLHLAGIRSGHKVLEIGTGTGYSAALSASMAGGAGVVVSIEYDLGLAEAARRNLDAAGYEDVFVLNADGRSGWPESTPYDVLVSTCTFNPAPAQWLRQVRPGGRLVVPCQSAFYPYGLLAATMNGDGTASGRFLDDANFMWDRGSTHLAGNPMGLFTHQDDADTSETALSPAAVKSSDAAQFAIGQLIPGLYQWTGRFDEPERRDWWTWWLYDGNGSWAACDVVPGADVFEVDQYGPRRLWTELEAAYGWWTDAGCPEVGRLGLLLTPDGQRVTFDGEVVAVPGGVLAA